MLLERPKVSRVICVLQPYLDSEMFLSVTESNLIPPPPKKSMPTHLTSSALGTEYMRSFSESLLEPPIQLRSLVGFFSPQAIAAKNTPQLCTWPVAGSLGALKKYLGPVKQTDWRWGGWGHG